MKRILALAMAVAMSFGGSRLLAAGPRAPQPPGSVAGTATTDAGAPLPNTGVQLRDLSTNQVIKSNQTNDKGEYVFNDVPPGNYVVEAVNASNQPIAASGSITVAAGQSVTGIVLQVNPALLAGGGAAAAAGGSNGMGAGASAAVMIIVAAATAFLGAQTGTNNASPSR